MKNIFLIILLIFPFSLLAQEPIKKNSINVSTGIAIGSGISQYYIGDDRYANFTLGHPNRSDFPKYITAGLNGRFGVDYQRILGRGFSLKIGLRVASWNLTTTSYSNEVSGLNNLYLEIPLAIQYSFGQKKWRPYFELGINPMISMGYINDYSSSGTYAIQMGIGISYQFGQKHTFYTQLSGRFQPVESIHYVSHETTSFVYQAGRYIYPYEIGLEIGLAFAF